MSSVECIIPKYKEITGNVNAYDVPVYEMKKVIRAYKKGRADERAMIIENINSYIDMLIEALNDKEENPIVHEALESSRADEIRIRKLIIEQLKEKHGNTGNN